LGIRNEGDYEIVASHSSFLAQRKEVAITQGQTVALDFDLTEAGFISGIVKNTNTSDPLEGAEVFVVEDSTNRTTTDAAGWYLLGVEPGTVNIDASLEGFTSPAPQPANATAGDTTNVPLFLNPISAGIVQGRVINDSFAPLADANVEVIELNVVVTTDGNGEFEVQLQPGTYTLRTSSECHLPAEMTLTLAAGEVLEPEIILVELKSEINGSVTDMNGNAIEGAFLEAVQVSGNFDTFSDSSNFAGGYEICLSGGQYNVAASHPGYQTMETLLQISDGQIKNGIDFVLAENFATVSGQVLDLTGNPITGAEVKLTNDLQELTDISGPDGSYAIRQVYPNRISEIRASKEGFYGQTEQVFLFGLDEEVQDLTLFPSDGSISGTVSNAGDGSFIPDVTVTAKFSGESGLFFRNTTNSSGQYNLTNLPIVPNATFTVDAFKESFVSGTPIVVPANTDNVDFLLFPLGGVIGGTIQDIDTAELIDSAKVAISGITGEAYSDSLGRFKFTGLDSTQLYELTTSQNGFFPQTMQNVATGDTNIVVEILRKYAFVRGRVTDSTSTALPDVEIRATPTGINPAGKESSVKTTASGDYTLKLIADEYEIRPFKLNYQSESGSVPLQLSEDSTITGIDFIMTKHTIAVLNIPGNSKISNLETPCFEADARDASGASVNIGAPIWRLNVSEDAAQIDDSGCLTMNPFYFGELTVTATDTISGVTGSLKMDVFAPIDSTSEMILFDDRGMQMIVQRNSVLSDWKLFNIKGPVAPAKKGRGQLFISDSSYIVDDLTKSPIAFNADKPPKLLLPPPPNTDGQKRFIAWWAPDSSKWVGQQDSSVNENNLIEASIYAAGEYVAASIAKPLAIDNLTLLPNPFSPHQEIEGRPGLKIEFDIASDAAPNPLVSLKIFNLEGNLVRELHDQTPFARGRNVVYWDGKADNGMLARNGRYLVQLVLEDPADKKRKMRSVVLIK